MKLTGHEKAFGISSVERHCIKKGMMDVGVTICQPGYTVGCNTYFDTIGDDGCR